MSYPENTVDLESPPSPSGTWSSSCTESSSAPSSSPSTPQSVHIVCKAPLVAPIPLPYHSPTFLQFELPDVDQDLSHPPYTQRTPKRKRILHEDVTNPIAPKRRSIPSASYHRPRHRPARCTSHHSATSATPSRLHRYT